ncbi:MAG: thioredoxin fold domain-containing protein [Flavobacteriaceae bacterium]|nr:thioredoxin fold domain-containing protein [Flavobacteriaceae bacterium]
MKRGILLILAVFFISITTKAQTNEINWMSMNEAIAAQAKNPKKIIMDAYTNWCGPCKLLDKNTFQNPDVVKFINEHFYAVKFNAEGDEAINYKDQDFANPNYDPSKSNSRNSQHQLAQALQIRAYPTIVFFDENGDTLVPLPGYKTPSQLEIYLKLFLNDRHKDIKTQEAWDDYQKSFQFEFKG